MKKQFKFPEEFLYLSTKVWLEDRGRGIYRLGITNYAQFNLDDIISITLPETGIFIEREEEIISIDSIEDTLLIIAPISGTINEINDELRQSPELLNESPYEEGWILEMELGSDDDLDFLMDSNEVLDLYQEQLDADELTDEELDESLEDLGELNYEKSFSDY
ncbi:MAG: glycine cleavage system protein H [Candidatus Heimdallarchaeota archaeon]|nr:glycine cleavage system protein H [Candidatus Heimdallarchaeota archaeon]MCK4955619.1 glycine cleavage system protein H [Candidatus Heimdallarchaeota archaeon]